MGTQCSGQKLLFQDLGRREVVARFDGGSITSDAGGLLLRARVDIHSNPLDSSTDFSGCLLSVPLSACGPTRPSGRRQRISDLVRFDGVLVVTDPALFRETVANGIGSGKAFGFGLLSLARL
jgi:hypothetical protein